MLIQDIKPYTGFNLYFVRCIEPRTRELAKLMGTYKQIEIKYIGGACDSSGSMSKCTNPGCSWFNHSQEGMR